MDCICTLYSESSKCSVKFHQDILTLSHFVVLLMLINFCGANSNRIWVFCLVLQDILRTNPMVSISNYNNTFGQGIILGLAFGNSGLVQKSHIAPTKFAVLIWRRRQFDLAATNLIFDFERHTICFVQTCIFCVLYVRNMTEKCSTWFMVGFLLSTKKIYEQLS